MIDHYPWKWCLRSNATGGTIEVVECFEMHTNLMPFYFQYRDSRGVFPARQVMYIFSFENQPDEQPERHPDPVCTGGGEKEESSAFPRAVSIETFPQ